MSTVTNAPRTGPGHANPPVAPPRTRNRRPLPRVALHLFLMGSAMLWLLPVAWALYTSFRPFADTAAHGYLSWPSTLTLDNYREAITRGDLLLYFRNTLVIVAPALIITLGLSTSAAFVLARFSFRFNIALLLLFTAGNLLPPQVVIMPLAAMYRRIAVPQFINDNGVLLDTRAGISLIHIGFQVGFCVFVMSNYMKLLPVELGEAAAMDGASVWQQFRYVILPLCRPPLAALATLQFTWMYNDFFWALVLTVSGDQRPITSALDNLRGSFFTDNNLIAAACILIALPTIAVYLLLQQQFVRGLTVGATKG